MPEAGDKLKAGGAGRLRYGLPSNLSGSLRHLDERQLDRLVRAVVEEARRRGRPVDNEGSSPPRPASGKTPVLAQAAGERAKRRWSPIALGQEKVIRAAFEAGVKPAAIARQFRVSRA